MRWLSVELNDGQVVIFDIEAGGDGRELAINLRSGLISG